MVEGLNAVVRDVYPGSAVSFKPNSPGGGVQAIATGQADFTATATGTEIRLALEGACCHPFRVHRVPCPWDRSGRRQQWLDRIRFRSCPAIPTDIDMNKVRSDVGR